MGLLRGKKAVSERTTSEDRLVEAAIRARVDQLQAESYAAGFTDGVVATTSLALGESVDGVEPYRGRANASLRVWLEESRRRATL